MQENTSKMLREEVTEADIADVIAKWTGIPVTKLVASERSKLLGLEDELHQRVIGQDEAVSAVADAIQRCRFLRIRLTYKNPNPPGECAIYDQSSSCHVCTKPKFKKISGKLTTLPYQFCSSLVRFPA